MMVKKPPGTPIPSAILSERLRPVEFSGTCGAASEGKVDDGEAVVEKDEVYDGDLLEAVDDGEEMEG